MDAQAAQASADAQAAAEDQAAADVQAAADAQVAADAKTTVYNLLYGKVVVFKAHLDTGSDITLIHGKAMPEGCAKFIISELIPACSKIYPDFDTDFHSKGSFLAWPLKDTQAAAADGAGADLEVERTLKDTQAPKKCKKREKDTEGKLIMIKKKVLPPCNCKTKN